MHSDVEDRLLKLLIVSYNYPPINTIGTQRIVSFVRHLAKLGWEVHVVTVRESKYVQQSNNCDLVLPGQNVCRSSGVDLRTMFGLLFKNVKGGGVTRAAAKKSISLKRIAVELYDNILTFPDSVWPWYFLGRRKALKYTLKIKPDLILSSSHPATSHMIASYIQRKTNVQWVADFRDLWSQNHLVVRNSVLQSITERFERKVLKRCACITTVSEPLSKQMRIQYKKPVYTVTNGFEPSEYDHHPKPYSKFTILYTGMLYPGKRDPTQVFIAIKELSDEGLIDSEEFCLFFLGPNHEYTLTMAKQLGVADFLETGQVDRCKAIEAQQKSHLLLLLEWDDPTAKGVFTGKFFEYLGANRFILATGYKGGEIDIALRNTGAGILENEKEGIKSVIRGRYRLYKKGVSPDVEGVDYSFYTRENQAKILSTLLKEVIG